MGFNCLKAREPLRGGSLLVDQEDYWNIGHLAKKKKERKIFKLTCILSIQLLLHFQDKLGLVDQVLVLVVIEH